MDGAIQHAPQPMRHSMVMASGQSYNAMHHTPEVKAMPITVTDQTVLQQLPTALEKKKFLTKIFKGLEYYHAIDDWKHIPRGTAVFGEQVVFGYPHIGRVLALEAGLKAHFQAPFWAEEKINGFNVRIARIGDKIVALTRGGFICPFTTDRLPDLMPLEIFQKEPGIIVCAEVAGPDNPYLESYPPFVETDIQLFVFDLMAVGKPGFFPYEEKLTLLEKYSLPSVPRFGRFEIENVEAIRHLILELHQKWHEGIVFKEDSERDHRAKYVTGNSNIDDIRAAADNLMELPAEYFTNRLLRLALFLEENGLTASATMKQDLGGAFLDGLHRAVEHYRREHRVYTTFRCRFREKENAELMLNHFKRASRHIKIVQRDLRQEEGHWLLEFDRIYPHLTGMLGDLLSGRMIFD